MPEITKQFADSPVEHAFRHKLGRVRIQLEQGLFRFRQVLRYPLRLIG